MTTTPPSSISSNWRWSSVVCGPAFQAWGTFSATAASYPGSASNRMSMPGASTSRSYSQDRAVIQPDLPRLRIDAGGVFVDHGDALGPTMS